MRGSILRPQTAISNDQHKIELINVMKDIKDVQNVCYCYLINNASRPDEHFKSNYVVKLRLVVIGRDWMRFY